MSLIGLQCERCATNYPLSFDFRPCPACGDPLSAQYDPGPTKEDLQRFLKPKATSGIDQYRSALPVSQDTSMVTLGEGRTPLVCNPQLNAEVGLSDLWIKNESGNPSWSFKDRLNAVNATLARENDCPGIVASSTGNHGASAAAYAAAAGLQSVVFFPFGTPEIYLDQVTAYGGRAVAMNWKDRGVALIRLVRDFGWFPSKSSLPAPISNPFGLEGYKTIAYEIVSDLGIASLPEFVFIPVGSGDDYSGIARGFGELLNAGVISKMPTLVACEAAGASPMFDAHTAGVDGISAVPNPRTIAVSISEGVVSNRALRALNAHGGMTCKVSDAEIEAASLAFARSGHVAESSSCVALAAASRFKAENRMASGARAVVVLTGIGLRWPSQMPQNTEKPVSVGRHSALDALWAGLEEQNQEALSI